MKIRLDSERCTGHGRCYVLAPDPPLSVTQLLHNDRPRRFAFSRDSYYWYYGTRYFKVVGGKDLWMDWQRSVVDALTDWQIRDVSCANGSWRVCRSHGTLPSREATA